MINPRIIIVTTSDTSKTLGILATSIKGMHRSQGSDFTWLVWAEVPDNPEIEWEGLYVKESVENIRNQFEGIYVPFKDKENLELTEREKEISLTHMIKAVKMYRERTGANTKESADKVKAYAILKEREEKEQADSVKS